MIFIGSFFCLTNQQEILADDRRYGEFALVVEADDKTIAAQMFRERIIKFRESSDFFEGDCSIFFMKLLEFENFPRAEAMMLSYKSTAGDPIMPFIDCLMPSDGFDFCRIHDWKDGKPEIDGTEEKLFLKFKN